MARTKGLSREQLLTSFLHRACDLSSSSLQIDSEGHLYASGEMVAAWREAVLFIDFGSNKVCNRRAANDLQAMAEKKNVVLVPYNTYSYPISREFQFTERMVSYPIWTTPERVNPKNIFQQRLKVLDKAVEKAISYGSIHDLIKETQRVASLFGFEFDATQYETQRKQQEQVERTKKQKAAQYHLQEYQRITQELEVSSNYIHK
jgi:hypothetical protein